MSSERIDARPALAAGRARMSPRRRGQISRGVQYVVIAVVLVLLALSADWGQLGETFFNRAALDFVGPKLPRAALNTITYTAAAFAVSISLGTTLALMKLSSVRFYRIVATGYVEFFRGIPALLVVFAFGYAIPTAFQIRFESIVLQIALALGSVSAAYTAETIRAGIQAVPKGQIEAARSLGLSSGATLRLVTIPQAFRIVLPPLTNEVVLLLKDTSLVFGLALGLGDLELTMVGRKALSQAEGGLTAIVLVGLVYLLITIPLSSLTRWLERKTGYKGHV